MKAVENPSFSGDLANFREVQRLIGVAAPATGTIQTQDSTQLVSQATGQTTATTPGASASAPSQTNPASEAPKSPPNSPSNPRPLTMSPSSHRLRAPPTPKFLLRSNLRLQTPNHKFRLFHCCLSSEGALSWSTGPNEPTVGSEDLRGSTFCLAALRPELCVLTIPAATGEIQYTLRAENGQAMGE